MTLPPLPEPLERQENVAMIVRAICAATHGHCKCVEAETEFTRPRCHEAQSCAWSALSVIREILSKG